MDASELLRLLEIGGGASAPLTGPIGLGVSALAGLAEAIFSGKPSGEEEALLKKMKAQMESGAPGEVIGRIRDSYSPRIARGITQRQTRIAAANASRGTSYGSGMLGEIGDIPSVEEQLAPMFAEADNQYRKQAAELYPQLLEMVTNRRNASIESGLGTVAKSAGTFLGQMGNSGVDTGDTGNPAAAEKEVADQMSTSEWDNLGTEEFPIWRRKNWREPYDLLYSGGN